MPTRNVLLICIAAVASFVSYQTATRNRYSDVISRAMSVVRDNFVEDVDPRQLLENAMSGMVTSLDQYSSFIGVDDFSAFKETLDQEFGGIGIVVEQSQESNLLTVMTPVIDTPAYRAGMRAGDVILQVEGHDAIGMSVKEAVKLMRGRPGTVVRLTVRRKALEDPIHMELLRSIIPIQSVLGDTRHSDGSWNFVLESAPQLGYIRVISFGENTTNEIEAALDQLSKLSSLQGLVVDLRNNAGGLLRSAVETCDLFLPYGPIVSTRGRNGVVRQKFEASSRTRLANEIPIVVLVNRYSASASEIVAACLQDHKRATVIGSRTWGKGTVQNVIELEPGQSALKLTTAKYWRPSGRDIHRDRHESDYDQWGVQPDHGFDISLTDSEFEATLIARRHRDVLRAPGESSSSTDLEAIADRQLQAAVELLVKVRRPLD